MATGITFDLSPLGDDGNRRNTGSDTWHVLVEYLEQQRAVLISQIVKSGIEHSQTEYLRGQLQMVEKLLALGKPQPVFEDEPYE